MFVPGLETFPQIFPRVKSRKLEEVGSEPAEWAPACALLGCDSCIAKSGPREATGRGVRDSL